MYNTVLGAKPLKSDGSAFYYSDYTFKRHKTYSNHRWPCRPGTPPQVAADHRINVYFHDGHGLYVNLYIPSTLEWSIGGARVQLRQAGEYPFETSVQLELKMSRPAEFALHLRIPHGPRTPQSRSMARVSGCTRCPEHLRT
jgi:DUF1680 family protein